MERQQLNNDLASSQSILSKKYLVLLKVGDNKLVFTYLETTLYIEIYQSNNMIVEFDIKIKKYVSLRGFTKYKKLLIIL
jgi:uncharacterized protein YccT (UPF0319 family)